MNDQHNLDKKNIEFKAQCNNLPQVRKFALEAGAKPVKTMHQLDIYYNVAQGRTKMRIIDNDVTELISYQRSNTAAPRQSCYSVKPVKWRTLVNMFYRCKFGEKVRVDKTRELLDWQGVRIHLDTVKDLGTFIELEAVVHLIGNEQEAEKRCLELMNRLQIRQSDLLSVSYSDLLAQRD